MKNILICGLGRMGSIHEKYIKSMNVKYSWYDPFKKDYTNKNRIDTLDSDTINNFTHIIISTPEGTHFDTYSRIVNLGFSGKFLVEKPVVTERNNLYILNNEDINSGLVERFNPAIQKLKSLIDVEKIVSMDFVRCSVKSVANQRVDSFTDVGIHDVDLYFFLTQFKKLPSYRMSSYSNTFSLLLTCESGMLSRFLWSNETFSKERKIIVRQTDCTYEVDLIDQTVKKFTNSSSEKDYGILSQNFYVEKASSIKNEIENFISDSGERVDSFLSHALYLKIKEELL
jgi:predicted dehydrogenase